MGREPGNEATNSLAFSNYIKVMTPYFSHPPAQLVEIVSQTGISLDPVYTLKGVRGILGEMEKNPGRFAGKRILYIHTGNS